MLHAMNFITVPNVLAVLYLVILEGILSVDNALALAALVRGRLQSDADQKKALHYGIIGAYIFRVAVIFAGVWLMQNPWVKWFAAAYLIYFSIKELFFKSGNGEEEHVGVQVSWLSPLWGTVIAVELMDIAFSIDSIAVALSVSNIPWVLIAGAVLGILAMRFAAQTFIKLIEKFPILERTAFVLVLFAGVKIVLELLGYEINDMIFMGVMFATIASAICIHYIKQHKRKKALERLRNMSAPPTTVLATRIPLKDK